MTIKSLADFFNKRNGIIRVRNMANATRKPLLPDDQRTVGPIRCPTKEYRHHERLALVIRERKFSGIRERMRVGKNYGPPVISRALYEGREKCRLNRQPGWLLNPVCASWNG